MVIKNSMQSYVVSYVQQNNLVVLSKQNTSKTMKIFSKECIFKQYKRDMS